MKKHAMHSATLLGLATAMLGGCGGGGSAQPSESATSASKTSYDISTLKGKVASINGTAGLQIRMSAFIEEEADDSAAGVLAPDGATLSDPADGGVILAPNYVMNQDTDGAPQNETSIAVDPNNPLRVVGSANDYVARTWSCTINGTPCSALADGYSGTYYSNDGGVTWAGKSSDPQHLATLIPGVTRLTGGAYDAGGDPALSFDSQGRVYYAGLGFNRASAPNTVAVNTGHFAGDGTLSWDAPVFINATTAPSTFNDKEWVVADHHAGSPFRDRVYVTWTRFVFNPANGNYVQSPIAVSYSSDGGATFSDPKLISGNVLYGQGSRPVVGADGTVYVLWDGAQRLSTYDSIWMVKSADGGATWSKPVAVAPLADIAPIANTVARVNSYPAAAVGADGTLYVAWSSQMKDSATSYSPAGFGDGAGTHAQAVYSKSSNGGATWSTPLPIFPALDAANRTPIGYTGLSLTPNVHRVDSFFPAVAASPTGAVYMGAYVADVVSPWQSCKTYDPNGSIHCLETGDYINNAKLDYAVTNLTTGVTKIATGKPINTRYNFRGGFIGDYTDIAAGSDGRVHASWTDSNGQQTIHWWYGVDFGGLPANQQDVVTWSDGF
jgi:hypothetical protein